MPREKPNYRDTLQFLTEKYTKMSLSKGETVDLLGITYPSLQKMIKKGELKADCCGKIPIGSLASYLCG